MCGGVQENPIEQEQRVAEIHAPVQEEEQQQQQEQLHQQAEPVQEQQEEAQQQQQQEQLQGPYAKLFRHFQPFPPGTPVPPEAAPQEHLGYKARRQRQKELARNLEAYRGYAGANRLFSAQEIQEIKNLPVFRTQEGREKWAATKLKHSNSTMGQTADQVRQGNFQNFENLDGVMRNLVAGKALRRFQREFDVMRMEPEAICQQLKERGGVGALLDPALRLGLSLAQRSEFDDALKARFRALDEAMSTAVMLETLTHRADQQVVEQDIQAKQPALSRDKVRDMAEKAVRANAAQQIQIAKRLMLMHLGTFQKITGQERTDWEPPVAVALSHCSRVNLTLPRMRSSSREEKDRHRQMWRSIFYQKDGSNPAGDNYRASSTHSILRRKVGGADTKEKKRLFNLIGQRGMNVAIGGLGNEGISRQILRNDGSCGHFYSMYKEADTTHYGAILMGLESDCAGVTNQMGHTHDAKATPEKASSLGGQRTDEIGNKYGGRACDLSGIRAEEITSYMETLEDAMKYWQRQPGGLDGGMPAEIMGKLVGRKMAFQDFALHVLPELNRAAQAYRREAGGV